MLGKLAIPTIDCGWRHGSWPGSASARAAWPTPGVHDGADPGYCTQGSLRVAVCLNQHFPGVDWLLQELGEHLTGTAVAPARTAHLRPLEARPLAQ